MNLCCDVISINMISLSNDMCEQCSQYFLVFFVFLFFGFTMNLSEKMPSLFSCNVSPSEMPQLYIGVTKSEPLAVAIPMTTFYSVVFCCGVCIFEFARRRLGLQSFFESFLILFVDY